MPDSRTEWSCRSHRRATSPSRHRVLRRMVRTDTPLWPEKRLRWLLRSNLRKLTPFLMSCVCATVNARPNPHLMQHGIATQSGSQTARPSSKRSEKRPNSKRSGKQPESARGRIAHEHDPSLPVSTPPNRTPAQPTAPCLGAAHCSQECRAAVGFYCCCRMCALSVVRISVETHHFDRFVAWRLVGCFRSTHHPTRAQ